MSRVSEQETQALARRIQVAEGANGRQVGGDHYHKTPGEQHWDRVWRLYGRGYFVGNITKYLERYPEKGGLTDLEKARHYLDKLIELEREAVKQGGKEQQQP